MELLLGRSIGKWVVVRLLGSLLLVVVGVLPLKAAEQLEVQLEGMVIPIRIGELTDWGRSEGGSSSELTTWLDLLDNETRINLLELLQAPLVRDQSMARQMLGSWAGRRLLDAVSDLIRVDDDSSGDAVLRTLERLLDRQAQVTTLDLLEALPARSVRIDLDGLLEVASRLRQQLQNHQQLLQALDRFPSLSVSPQSALALDAGPEITPELVVLSVPHRARPLSLEVWRPSLSSLHSRSSWVLMMPGLGSSPDHFRWLAITLSRHGWPVVLLEHPGSDAKAVQALLMGRQPPPGAEVLPDRLEDLQAVLMAHQQGRLQLPGQRLVLAGHSLGSLTALLAAGADPEPGLAERCAKALDDLSLTNLSRLLQCQLSDVPLPKQKPIPQLEAIVALNSFGSLLWPGHGDAAVPVPVLFAGGTFDLITPPLSEQLDLLLATPAHPASRVLLVEGASHFSPVRVEAQPGKDQEDDLFQLGEELVGVQPLAVQSVLAAEIRIFLEQVESGEALVGSSHQQLGSLRMHRLDRSAVENLRGSQ